MTHGSFPLDWGDPRVNPVRGHPYYVRGRPYSALTRLLSSLDQQPLHASINFEVETFATEGPSVFPFPQNETAYRQRLAVYLCPSDAAETPSHHGCNYRGNYGVGPSPSTSQEQFDSGTGFYSFPGVRRPSSFPDGLSHTVAYSERIRGTGGSEEVVPSRDFAEILVMFYCTSRDADYALNCCRLAARRRFPAYRSAGFTWFYSNFESTAYNHAQEPNGKIPDAIHDSGIGGIVTARSLHPGGINSVMADGSVRFVKGSVERRVWRALGTRSGGELVE